MLDRLTLDQLRILVAVAETGSFSAAARRLGRVQSAISQSVQSLEDVLQVQLFSRGGKTPTLTEAGAALLEDARYLIRGAETLRARAQSMAEDVEPELTLAIDSMFPSTILMESLRGLSREFPNLPVTVFTEGLGGPEQRLRDGVARLGICVLLTAYESFETEFLTSLPAVAVVAADHPLAREPEPLTRDQLEPQVQLVLTDRTPLTQSLRGGIFSRRIWRFADLQTRLEYLLAGFGWCNMPLNLVEEHIKAGRLKRLVLKELSGFEFRMQIVYPRGGPPRRAGQWLIADLRRQLSDPKLANL